jgi:hypothetical protein
MKLADISLLQLTKAIEHNFKKNNLEHVLELICAKARLLYIYNQKYRDDQSETLLNAIADKFKTEFSHRSNDKTVLFYDGFGLDARGLVQQYLTGLVENNYKVLYISVSPDESEQPHVSRILKRGNGKFLSLQGKNFIDKIVWLRNVCSYHCFSYAFLYTTPYDVASIVTFSLLKEKAIRYQINLTDHAFWLGAQAFDYCIEFRNYGAAITRDYRKVNSEKLVYLPYYPILNEYEIFQGFPELIKNKKVILSGGATYKTLDNNNTFYNIVESLLDKHNDVAFMYLSNDTVKQLDSLKKKYPQRVVHLSERSDLIEVMKHSRLFLNTYPISGGLMVQYAAISGCIPVTLKREWDDDAVGLLKNENVLNEIFTVKSKFIDEIGRLLEDENYFKEKKKMLEGQVLTPAEFAKGLQRIIINPKETTFTDIKSVDTKMYRQSLAENLSRNDVIQCLIRKETPKVCRYFPKLTVEWIIKRLFK